MKLTTSKIQIILNYLISQKGLKTDSQDYAIISQVMSGTVQKKILFNGTNPNPNTIGRANAKYIPFVEKVKGEMLLKIDSKFPNDLLTSLNSEVSNEKEAITVTKQVSNEKEITVTVGEPFINVSKLQNRYDLLLAEFERREKEFEAAKELLQNEINLKLEENENVLSTKNELMVELSENVGKLGANVLEITQKLTKIEDEKAQILIDLAAQKESTNDLLEENSLLLDENEKIAAANEQVLNENKQLLAENKRLLERNLEVENMILYKLAVLDWAKFVKKSIAFVWIACMICVSVYQINKMGVYFNVQMSLFEACMLAIVVEVMLWGINIARFANVFDDYEDSDNLKYLSWCIFVIRSATGAFANYYFMVNAKASGGTFTDIEKIYLGQNFGESGQFWTAIVVSAFFVAIEMLALKLIIKFFFSMFLTKNEE